jgi:uncharacterized membrane protein
MIGYGDFGWMVGFGWLMMLLVWAVVIALVVLGAGAVFRARDRASEPMPLEILKRCYAAGEITATEFEQAKRALT